MSHQVIWTRRVLETFIREGNLTPIEEQIMRTRVKGWTRTRQSEELNLSLSALDVYIRRLKKKYDAVQKEHPGEMPKRKASAAELYMDKH